MANQTLVQRFTDSIVEVTILRFIPATVRPNAITFIRIAITPLVVWLVLHDHFLTGVVVFIFAAITDLVDGAMARTRDQITDLGKVIDPIADKLLIGSLMVPLVAVYLNLALAFIILVLEILFLIGGLIRKFRGTAIQANWWGKIKFNCQVLGIIFLLFAIMDGGSLVFTQLSIASFSMGLGFGAVSLFTHGF